MSKWYRSSMLMAAMAFAPAATALADTGAGGTSNFGSSAARAVHATAIPAFARRYNLDCSTCHYPAAPRLNGVGQRFMWAGYRMPNEIGQQMKVAGLLSNYMAVVAIAEYNYEKTSGQPATTSQFNLPAVEMLYAGPFGSHYAGFVELEREAADDIGIRAEVVMAWGKENSYGGFRVGKMHFIGEYGTSGFNRPVGVNFPLSVDGTITGSIPFNVGESRLGGEAFYVMGRNRIAATVLNGIGPDGCGACATTTKKDIALSDQYVLDDAGSGITALAYYGTLQGADPAFPVATSHFLRMGLSANKIINNFEGLGGVMYGKDTDLPTGGIFATPENKGLGYWVSGQYYLPESRLTLFGRYEQVDPNTDASGDAVARVSLGAVLPLNQPQHLRLAVEYWMDNPQASGVNSVNSITAQLLLAF